MQSLQGVGVGFVTSDWLPRSRILRSLRLLLNGSLLRTWGAAVLSPYNGEGGRSIFDVGLRAAVE